MPNRWCARRPPQLCMLAATATIVPTAPNNRSAATSCSEAELTAPIINIAKATPAAAAKPVGRRHEGNAIGGRNAAAGAVCPQASPRYRFRMPLRRDRTSTPTRVRPAPYSTGTATTECLGSDRH
ncbi:hypothetical protein GCM10020218_018190 [Dactylosporangium vinaceum]